VTVEGASIPRLGRGMKLREDATRGRWVVMGPERMFVPDEIALEVLPGVPVSLSSDVVPEMQEYERTVTLDKQNRTAAPKLKQIREVALSR